MQTSFMSLYGTVTVVSRMEDSINIVKEKNSDKREYSLIIDQGTNKGINNKNKGNSETWIIGLTKESIKKLNVLTSNILNNQSEVIEE